MKTVINPLTFVFSMDIEGMVENKPMVSLTVPGESMTIPELMRRHVQGIQDAKTMMREPLFEEDVDFDSPDMQKVKNLDFVEKDALKAAVDYKVSEIKQKQAAERAAKKREQDASKKANEKGKDEPAKDEPKNEPKKANPESE